MQLGSFKLLSAVLILAVGWVGVELPRAMQRNARLLSSANLFSAGVMLGGGLLHLLPDAAEQLEEAWKGVEYPLAHLFFAFGLLLPLAAETLLAPAAHLHDEVQIGGEQLSDRGEALSLCCGSYLDEVPTSDRDMHSPHVHHTSDGLRSDVPLSAAMVLLAALSFHSVLEGLAQGTASSLDSTIVLLGAILLHKGLAAFALGVMLVQARLSRRLAAALGLLFAAATPLGIVAGMSLPYEEGGALSAALVAMAGGSFTFVAVLEVLPRELHASLRGGAAGRCEALAMLGLGFTLMALLGLWL